MEDKLSAQHQSVVNAMSWTVFRQDNWHDVITTIVEGALNLSRAEAGFLCLYDRNYDEPDIQTLVGRRALDPIVHEYLRHYRLKTFPPVEPDQLSLTEGQWFLFPMLHTSDNTLLGALGVLCSGVISRTILISVREFLVTVVPTVERFRELALATQKSHALETSLRIIQNAKALNHRGLIEEILRNISALVSCEIAGIMLLNPQNMTLELQYPAFGVYDQGRINQYRVSLNERSNAVRVFLSGQPAIINDPFHNPVVIQKYLYLFGGHSILTVPLTVGNRRIGIIHAVNKINGPFGPTDAEILLVAANYLAFILEHADPNNISDPLDDMENLIRALVTNSVRLDFDSIPKSIAGLDLEQPLRVIALLLENRDANLPDVSRQLNWYLMVNRIGAGGCALREHLAMIVPDSQCHALKQTLQEQVIRISRASKCLVVCGGRAESLRLIAGSYQQALFTLALNVLDGLWDNNAVNYDDVGLMAKLYEGMRASDSMAILSRYLEPFDSQRGRDLLDTVQQYLETNQNAKMAAQRLYCHVNTVMYRVKQFEKVIGSSLEHSSTRLQWELIFRHLSIVHKIREWSDP